MSRTHTVHKTIKKITLTTLLLCCSTHFGMSITMSELDMKTLAYKVFLEPLPNFRCDANAEDTEQPEQPIDLSLLAYISPSNSFWMYELIDQIPTLFAKKIETLLAIIKQEITVHYMRLETPYKDQRTIRQWIADCPAFSWISSKPYHWQTQQEEYEAETKRLQSITPCEPHIAYLETLIKGMQEFAVELMSDDEPSVAVFGIIPTICAQLHALAANIQNLLVGPEVRISDTSKKVAMTKLMPISQKILVLETTLRRHLSALTPPAMPTSDENTKISDEAKNLSEKSEIPPSKANLSKINTTCKRVSIADNQHASTQNTTYNCGDKIDDCDFTVCEDQGCGLNSANNKATSVSSCASIASWTAIINDTNVDSPRSSRKSSTFLPEPTTPRPPGYFPSEEQLETLPHTASVEQSQASNDTATVVGKRINLQKLQNPHQPNHREQNATLIKKKRKNGNDAENKYKKKKEKIVEEQSQQDGFKKVLDHIAIIRWLDSM